MQKIFYFLIFISISWLSSCNSDNDGNQSYEYKVSNLEELNVAIDSVKAGQTIVMANGIWKDVEIVFQATGTKSQPITLRAETPGQVSIEGASNLKLGGEYLIVKDLLFQNGHTPSGAVIEFRIDNNTFANNCVVTQCVIDEFTQPNRDDTDHWVEFWGRHNELSNCYIAGKSNFGPTVMVMLKGNEHIKNNHQIINNHFGPRPRKGGPHGETMQIGDSGTSMTPSQTNVEGNLFERCNGEVEIISSKSNYNTFKNNVFFESEGSLVLRHGNYATIDGNMFIGNDNSEFIGGIRVINTGHWIYNNYFYKLKGQVFRAPLAVMNGIPKSPQNRYNQVTDVVMAYNSFIDCETPFHFSVGSNVSQSEVLPKSEIRSARPVRTIVANNVIYNETAFDIPIKNYDEVDGVQFENNYSNSNNNSEYKPEGLMTVEMNAHKRSDRLIIPELSSDSIYQGFDFETITSDLFGNERTESNNKVGAIVATKEQQTLFDRNDYGTNWYQPKQKALDATTITVTSNTELESNLNEAAYGSTLLLKPGTYTIKSALIIDKDIKIGSENKNEPAELIFESEGTAFELHPTGTLRLENLKLTGDTQQNTFTTLDKNMTKAYNLFLESVEISKFDKVLEVSKGSFADTVSVSNSKITKVKKGLDLNKETNDGGDYNAAFVIIKNSEFDQVSETVLDYYRGGYDESTIGGHLTFTNNTVSNSGRQSADKILIKNRGIVNAVIADNTFNNNPVKLIAILWGEKGQKPENNTIANSGEFKVVQNLELKLMY